MGAIITRASGFAVDAGQALWERVGVVINTFLTWVEQTNAKMVDGQTGPDVSLLKDLDKALKDSYKLAAKARSELRMGSACMLLADKSALTRNPFVDEHEPQSASVPDVWVYTHPQNGVMRLLQEILRCCRIEGSLTALSTCCR